MSPHDIIDLEDCPYCGGPALLEEEGGWCLYITCMDCGAHTAELEFRTPEERLDAAKRAADVWNMRKVIGPGPGE